MTRENLKETLDEIKDTIDELIDKEWAKIRGDLFSLQDKLKDSSTEEIDIFLNGLPADYAAILKSKFKSVKEKIEIKKKENKNISSHELKRMLNEIEEDVSSILPKKKN